jgi:hypothetical protein
MADWTPLAEGDPLPGDPNGLGSLVTLLANDARELSGVLGDLKKVDAEEVWTGENADRFTAARDKVAPQLDRVADTMRNASEALRRCLPGMGNSQGLARTALTRARDATGNLTKANAGLDEAARVATGPNVPVTPGAVWTPNWTGVRDEAQDELDDARRLFDKARLEYDEAIERCVKELKQILTDIEKISRNTTERLIDKAGELSLGLLGQGASGTMFGLGRTFGEKGFGRVSHIGGRFEKESRAGAVLPYRWIKNDYFEKVPLSKGTLLLKGIDDAVKPYAKVLNRLQLATKTWGVFGKEHDRKDVNEAEAVVATAWKVGTEQGGSFVGSKIGAQAGAAAGAQAGTFLGTPFGPVGMATGAVAGAIVGGFYGAWAGGELGGKVGKLVGSSGQEALKLGTGLARGVGKGVGEVAKKLNPFRW